MRYYDDVTLADLADENNKRNIPEISPKDNFDSYAYKDNGSDHPCLCDRMFRADHPAWHSKRHYTFILRGRRRYLLTSDL